MNLTAILPGALLGIGAAMLVFALLPQQPKLSAVIERIGTTTPILDHVETDRETRIGAWVHRRLPDLPGFTIPTRDLELVGTPVNAYLYQKARDAFLLFLATWALALVLLVIAPGFTFPALIASIPLAALGWTGADRDLKKAASAAREEFARGVAIFLELIATERRRNAPPTVALESAAAEGESWVFIRLQEELRRARFAGIPSWEALSAFADAIDVPELAEVARITRSADETGSSIYETLRARGKGMRVKLLTEEQTRANKVSEDFSSVAGPAVAFVFIGIVVTPLVLNLMG